MDENVQPTEEDRDVSLDAKPIDANPAHSEDEDPEQHMGDEIPDPWSDPAQTDWPKNETEEESA